MQNSQTPTAPLPMKHTSTPLALGLFTEPHLDNLHGVLAPAHRRKKNNCTNARRSERLRSCIWCR